MARHYRAAARECVWRCLPARQSAYTKCECRGAVVSSLKRLGCLSMEARAPMVGQAARRFPGIDGVSVLREQLDGCFSHATGSVQIPPQNEGSATFCAAGPAGGCAASPIRPRFQSVSPRMRMGRVNMASNMRSGGVGVGEVLPTL